MTARKIFSREAMTKKMFLPGTLARKIYSTLSGLAYPAVRYLPDVSRPVIHVQARWAWKDSMDDGRFFNSKVIQLGHWALLSFLSNFFILLFIKSFCILACYNFLSCFFLNLPPCVSSNCSPLMGNLFVIFECLWLLAKECFGLT